MWTSCEKQCAAGASFGSHGKFRAGHRETSPQSKMAYFTRKGPYSCTAGLFFDGKAFLLHFCLIPLHACIVLTKCWTGSGTLTPGWLKRHDVVGLDGREWNGATLGDLSIRRMMHGGT